MLMMTDKPPIDYARAESADVVRKKRRLRAFALTTTVAMVIGFAWISLGQQQTWLIGSRRVNNSVSVSSDDGWINFFGSSRKTTVARKFGQPKFEEHGNRRVGIWMLRSYWIGQPQWIFSIRYRTLFILATIPWLITLIRLIRSWRRKRIAQSAGMS